MSIVHCKDSRRNVTYVYESTNYWDKSAKKYKAKRRCIGKLDSDGNLVPTRGHPGRPPKADEGPKAQPRENQNAAANLQAIVTEQAQRIRDLELLLEKKERKLAALSKGLSELAKQLDID